MPSKGQIHTFEALFAILLISGVTFQAVDALQPTTQLETPDDVGKQEEIRSDAETVVEQSAQDGSIKMDLLNWDEENNRYELYEESQSADGLYLTYTNSSFGNRLLELEDRYDTQDTNTNINVEVVPAKNGTATGSNAEVLDNAPAEELEFITTGAASQKSVTVTETVMLHGSDRLKTSAEAFQRHEFPSEGTSSSKQLYELTDSDSFPIPPQEDYSNIGEDDVYNTVTVRVIIWI